ARPRIKATIRNFAASGGYAFKWAATSPTFGGDINLIIQNCESGMDFEDAAGVCTMVGGRIRAISINNTAANHVTGVPPDTLKNDVDIQGYTTAGVLNYRLSSQSWRVFCNTTPVGNSGTGTDNLQVNQLIVGVLGHAGKGVRIRQEGITANNSNPKT